MQLLKHNAMGVRRTVASKASVAPVAVPRRLASRRCPLVPTAAIHAPEHKSDPNTDMFW